MIIKSNLVELPIYHPYIRNMRGEFKLDDIKKIESTSVGLAKITLPDNSEHIVTISFADLQKLFDLKQNK